MYIWSWRPTMYQSQETSLGQVDGKLPAWSAFFRRVKGLVLFGALAHVIVKQCMVSKSLMKLWFPGFHVKPRFPESEATFCKHWSKTSSKLETYHLTFCKWCHPACSSQYQCGISFPNCSWFKHLENPTGRYRFSRARFSTNDLGSALMTSKPSPFRSPLRRAKSFVWHLKGMRSAESLAEIPLGFGYMDWKKRRGWELYSIVTTGLIQVLLVTVYIVKLYMCIYSNRAATL